MMEYVAKFTELACFDDDYVATDMVKVRKFENGLKFSIQSKIVGLLLQDIDSAVRTAITVEREVEDAWSIWDEGASAKMKENQPSSSSSGKKHRTSASREFQRQGRGYQGQGQGQLSQDRGHFRTPS